MSKIIEDLNWRYATKDFDSTKKISDEDMNTLLESLRLTPSSFGMQPWHFVVVQNTEKREQLVEKSWGQKQISEASHLIILCRLKEVNDSNVDQYVNDMAKTRGDSLESLEGFSNMIKGFISRKDENGQEQWMKDQAYIALGNLMTVCAQMRIDSCPMEGFSPKGYDEVLRLGDKGLWPVLVCPVGYRKDSDKYATLEKVRFPLKDLVTYIK